MVVHADHGGLFTLVRVLGKDRQTADDGVLSTGVKGEEKESLVDLSLDLTCLNVIGVFIQEMQSCLGVCVTHPTLDLPISNLLL